MHVDLHKRSVDKRTDTRQGTGGVSKETHNVHYALHKWVCAETFVDHEWASSRTSVQQEEEILSMTLEFKIDVPCVEQLESIVGFLHLRT